MADIVAEVIEIMSGDSLANDTITLDSVHEADQLARIRARDAIDRK